MVSLDSLKVAQLKAALKSFGADTKGSKGALVARLKEILAKKEIDVDSFLASFDAESQTPGSVGVAPDAGVHDEDAASLRGASNAGSETSVRTSDSLASFTSLRATESAKKAGLLAKARRMEEKKRLEFEEFEMKKRLEMAQLEIKTRREELELETEIAEADARERVFLDIEDERRSDAGVRTRPSNGGVEQGPYLSVKRVCEVAVHMDESVAPLVSNSNPYQYSTAEQIGEAQRHAVAQLSAGVSQPPSGAVQTPASVAQPLPAEPFGCGAASQMPRVGSQQIPANPQLPGSAPQLPCTASQHTPDVSHAVLAQLERSSLPKADIPIFNGDVTRYRGFIRSFDSRIASRTSDDEERLSFLYQFTSGKPRDVVRACLHLPEGSGYMQARRLLERRYGDADSISTAFVDMLLEWPQVKPGDLEGLDRYSLALTSCLNALQGVPAGTRETDQLRTMRAVIGKLPAYLQDRWRRYFDKIQEKETRKVVFEDIVAFVDDEVRIQTSPFFGKFREDRGKKASHVVSAVTGAGGMRTRPPVKCIFCSGEHYTDLCQEMRRLAWDKRREFVNNHNLCYGCLRRNHRYEACRRKLTCADCHGRHPTVMHKDTAAVPGNARDATGAHHSHVRNARVAASLKMFGVTRSSAAMMAVLPVKVWSADRNKSAVCYAFLDTGSSATFCTEQLLESLGMTGDSTRLSMTTAASEDKLVDARLAKGLGIQGFDDSTAVMEMPPTFTLDKIPVKREDIATVEDVQSWPHLNGVPLPDVDAEIGLMIGVNCPRLLAPIEVRSGSGNGPIACRTALGWVIYGPRNGAHVNHTLRVNRVRVKGFGREDADLHNQFVALYNQDFSHDNSSGDVGLSVEDQIWMKTVEEGTRLTEGRYEIPLPLKTGYSFPDNRQQVEQRAKFLKRRMKKNDKYLEDYKEFVNQLIKRDYVERVKEDDLLGQEGKLWYIPHHAVLVHAMCVLFTQCVLVCLINGSYLNRVGSRVGV